LPVRGARSEVRVLIGSSRSSRVAVVVSASEVSFVVVTWFVAYHHRDQSGRHLQGSGCRSARRDSRIVHLLRLLRASLRPCCVEISWKAQLAYCVSVCAKECWSYCVVYDNRDMS
jgi:hypothetical protein